MSAAARSNVRRHACATHPSSDPKRDAYQAVTDAIIAALEAGTAPWQKSWTAGQGASVYPLRHNGEAYRGINVLILWARQLEAGFDSPYWMTYQQAQELGGQVRKGEKSTLVCYYGTGREKHSDNDDSNAPTVFRFLRTFCVFNTDQIDNLPDHYRVEVPQVIPASERIDEIEQLLGRLDITVRHGGNRAYYSVNSDHIQMPHFESFATAECYYATRFHECVHATGAHHRLDRNLVAIDEPGNRAREELVAELGAAFLGSTMGFAPYHIDAHASYLAAWLKQMREDKKMIFSVAAKAQAAADYILGRDAVSPGRE